MFIFLITGIFVIILVGQFQFLVTNGQSVIPNRTDDKVVILNFDDSRKSQYTNANQFLTSMDLRALSMLYAPT